MKKEWLDKDRIVAEIDDWRDKIKKGIFSIPLTGSDKAYATFEYEILGKVRDLLDTLEAKEVDLENSVKGRIDYPFIGYDFPNIYPNYKELKEYCDRKGIKDNDKVKLIIIKDM